MSSRNALRFFYEESVGCGNADITLILEEALRCSDRLIAEGQEISYESRMGCSTCIFSEPYWASP